MSIKQLPADVGGEVAFAGRSNTGKSSVINKLTNRKGLARTGKRPGRTREINYFSCDQHTHIVDLPGYGYAEVNASLRNTWATLLDYYLRERQALRGIFLIMDIRRPPGKFDRQMLDYCQNRDLLLHILLNKSDKLSRSAGAKAMEKVKEWAPDNTNTQLFSALKGDGVETARTRLATWLFSDK